MREAQATDNEQDVRKQLEEWEYKGRLLETLVTMLTYEVRTPLTAILGYSEILLQDAVGEVNEKQKECFTAIGNYAESTMTAFDRFVDAHYALLSGRLYLKFEEVDIEELLRAIKPDNLNLEIPKEIPKIWGDPRHLARAFEVFFSEAMLGWGETKASLQINYNNERMNFRIVSEVGRGYSTRGESIDPMLFYSQMVIEQHGGEYQLVRLEEGVEITILLPINRDQESV